MSIQHVSDMQRDGFAIIRGLFSMNEVQNIRCAVEQVYTEGMKHHASYRDGNIAFELLNDPGVMQKVVIQAYWFAWINLALEAQRRHANYLQILQPLLGPSIKQIANQIHWKHPGAKYTSYRFHQDMRFRENKEVFTDLANSYVTTALAINKVDADNGALMVFPGSHKLGYLGLSDKYDRIMQGQTSGSDYEAEQELSAAGLNLNDAIVCELEPGDLVMWNLLTVHGSGANTSQRNRPLILNSYVRAENSPHRGEWAFRDGVSTALGREQNICRFEDLHQYSEPFYNEYDWTGEQPNLEKL